MGLSVTRFSDKFGATNIVNYSYTHNKSFGIEKHGAFLNIWAIL
jgi:hypothetical protein